MYCKGLWGFMLHISCRLKYADSLFITIDTIDIYDFLLLYKIPFLDAIFALFWIPRNNYL